jgi:hypothetical protein
MKQYLEAQFQKYQSMGIDFSASHSCAAGSPTGKKLSAGDISRPYCLVVGPLSIPSFLALYIESLSSITEMRFLYIESADIKNNKM